MAESNELALAELLATAELSNRILRETHDANVKAMESLVKKAQRWKKALQSIAASESAGVWAANYAKTALEDKD